MKAMVLRDGRFALEQLADPAPAPGEMLVRPLLCGVCGSDLHAKDHADHLCDLLHRAGFRGFMDPTQSVVMGHEFCCELIEPAGVFAAGQRVVGLPFITGGQGIELIGYSNRYNGAFAEAMLLDPALCHAVPDHVPTDIAALAEPLSVAVHAVAEAHADRDCAFAVVGCGPVGLFVIARLRALGLGPILAIEPNAARRAMAERMGADIVMAPGDAAGDQWWTALGLPIGMSDAMAVAAEAKQRSRAVLFDCVGKPGMLMTLAKTAPTGATIVVVGNCMETDAIEPAFLLQKGLTLRFVFAYSPAEFSDAFAMIVADPDRLAPMVTGHVGLTQIDDAFAALTSGDASQVKILVSPS
jgi:threonine dehydrogenase-like Zn-dependent dehydrogenase